MWLRQILTDTARILYARYLFEAWLTLIDIRRILRKTGLWNIVRIASVSDCVLPLLTLLMFVLFLGVQIVCKWTGFLALRKNILPPSLLPRRWWDITLFFRTRLNRSPIPRYFRATTSGLGAHGAVVVKALHYKPAGRGFDSRWCHWNFSVT